MAAYYNEIDSAAAEWLRKLIEQGLIAPGDVDERSIEDVVPGEISGYTQHHFFAGIGVWSYALRRAGWPDDRPVWTGSCPCQPFSSAGKGDGFADERHLWPHFHWLISQCRPAIIFGEQVASKDGLSWLDLVQADLEGSGYSSGAVDTCAAGFGAPHIRQRLYWVAKRLADTNSERRKQEQDQRPASILGTAYGTTEQQRQSGDYYAGAHGMANTNSERCREARYSGLQRGEAKWAERDIRERDTGPTNGFWRDADWLFCRDGKWRPVESGTFPLAHGPAARVGRLRGYGNAIVAPQAQAFIEAAMKMRLDVIID